MTKMDYDEEENILDYSLDNISIRTDILQRMVCNFVSCPVTCQPILFQGHYALVPAIQPNKFPCTQNQGFFQEKNGKNENVPMMAFFCICHYTFDKFGKSTIENCVIKTSDQSSRKMYLQ